VRGMRLTYAALIAISFVFSGHAAAAGFGPGLVACVHIAIAGWWIGSLVAMQRACATQDIASVSSIVLRFSAIAVRAIVVLVLAGVVLILALVTLPVVVTPYLATLGIKLGIATLVFALASHNKFRLTPRLLAGDATVVRSLRTSIDVELFLIGAVLIATAIMTTYNAPEE
jgi:putative copper export protein